MSQTEFKQAVSREGQHPILLKEYYDLNYQEDTMFDMLNQF